MDRRRKNGTPDVRRPAGGSRSRDGVAPDPVQECVRSGSLTVQFNGFRNVSFDSSERKTIRSLVGIDTIAATTCRGNALTNTANKRYWPQTKLEFMPATQRSEGCVQKMFEDKNSLTVGDMLTKFRDNNQKLFTSMPRDTNLTILVYMGGYYFQRVHRTYRFLDIPNLCVGGLVIVTDEAILNNECNRLNHILPGVLLPGQHVLFDVRVWNVMKQANPKRTLKQLNRAWNTWYYNDTRFGLEAYKENGENSRIIYTNSYSEEIIRTVALFNQTQARAGRVRVPVTPPVHVADVDLADDNDDSDDEDAATRRKHKVEIADFKSKSYCQQKIRDARMKPGDDATHHLYGVLGLEFSNHPDSGAIKRAYFREARQWHPDKNMSARKWGMTSETITDRFLEIERAKRVLYDSENAKIRYDERGDYARFGGTSIPDKRFDAELPRNPFLL